MNDLKSLILYCKISGQNRLKQKEKNKGIRRENSCYVCCYRNLYINLCYAFTISHRFFDHKKY